MIVAGIGCRRDAPAAEILAAIEEACRRHRLSPTAIQAIVTVEHKQHESGLRNAAKALSLPLFIAPRAAACSAITLTQSAVSLAATGLPSTSEAAALAACGEGGRLLGPRIIVAGATCALAQIGDEE